MPHDQNHMIYTKMKHIVLHLSKVSLLFIQWRLILTYGWTWYDPSGLKQFLFNFLFLNINQTQNFSFYYQLNSTLLNYSKLFFYKKKLKSFCLSFDIMVDFYFYINYPPNVAQAHDNDLKYTKNQCWMIFIHLSENHSKWS